MSKNTRLCPFRKTAEQWTDSITGQTTMRERFQTCIGKKCMAYVFTAPIITEGSAKDPNCWGCARLLNRGVGNED